MESRLLTYVRIIFDSYASWSSEKRSNYKHMRKQLQQVGTASARRKLKRIGGRENRWMSDVNHQVSKALVERYGANTLFVVEDLTGIRQAIGRVKIKDRCETVSWSFYQLRQMIEYKALIAGSKVIAVSPRYTSQTCPKCGHTEKANRNKKDHTFCCKTCEYKSNDDRIGAMNLNEKELSASLKGLHKYGLCSWVAVNLPKVTPS